MAVCACVLHWSCAWVLFTAVPWLWQRDWPCQCHLCFCVHVCVSRIGSRLCCWLNLQRGKWQLCPSAWAETPGPQALGWAPAAEQQGLGQGRLEEVAGPNLP